MIKRMLNAINFWIALLSVISLVWYHGFAHSSNDHQLHSYWLGFALTYFLFQFVYRVRSAGNRLEFLRINWLEGATYLVAIGVTIYVFLDWVKIPGVSTGIPEDLQRLTLHMLLLLISGVEMIIAASRSTIWKLPLPVLLVSSYIIIILAGSVILRLPMMLNSHIEPSYFQALFTSVSASCVTGLVTVNIADYYSSTGHLVILILIQLGGLNIVAFATYFIARFSHVDKQTLRGNAVKEVLTVNTFSGAKNLLQRIIGMALLVEGVGVVLLYYWSDYLTPGTERLFHSVFHSVSAFNNAGFTIIDGGLTNSSVLDLWGLHFLIAFLIILGGLGFATLMQIGVLFKSGSRSEFSFNSWISLKMAVALIATGMIFFLIMEWRSHDSFWDQLCQAFFQSVTARTAGFSTVQVGALGLPTMMLLMLFMFIGASPGSTGGGIKTTTLFVFITKATKSRSLIHQHTIDKAKKLTLFGLLTVFLGTTIMYYSETEFKLSQLLFEQVSAFGTVGLSTGITSQLGRVSLGVIMITMFIGRVGPLALAYSVIAPSTDEIETRETLLIGEQ